MYRIILLNYRIELNRTWEAFSVGKSVPVILKPCNIPIVSGINIERVIIIGHNLSTSTSIELKGIGFLENPIACV